MSDEEAKQQPLKLLTTEQVKQYVEEKHTLPCPSCGKQSWSVIHPPEKKAGFLSFYEAKRLKNGSLFPESVAGQSVFAVAHVLCTSCGLVHTYSYRMIEKWVAARTA